jgi:hypothetical protein
MGLIYILVYLYEMVGFEVPGGGFGQTEGVKHCDYVAKVLRGEVGYEWWRWVVSGGGGL